MRFSGAPLQPHVAASATALNNCGFLEVIHKGCGRPDMVKAVDWVCETRQPHSSDAQTRKEPQSCQPHRHSIRSTRPRNLLRIGCTTTTVHARRAETFRRTSGALERAIIVSARTAPV